MESMTTVIAPAAPTAAVVSARVPSFAPWHGSAVAAVSACVRVPSAAVVVRAAVLGDERLLLAQAPVAVALVNADAAAMAVDTGVAQKQAHTYARPRVNGSQAWS